MNTAQITVDLKKINCAGSFLEDFVENFPESCHVREVQTNKYLIANHHMVINCGLKSIDQIIGFTPYDIWIDKMTQNEKNVNQNIIQNIINNIQNFTEIEKQILSTKRPISRNRFILNLDWIIRFQNVLKLGIQNQDYKIIVFLSVFIDITHQINLHKLFIIYQEFYSKKEAVQKFLNYLNIESYFDHHVSLTYTEVQVLIYMRDDSRAKSVAKKLGCSIATAANHIANIRNKLKSCTLHEVLSKLPAISKDEQNIFY